MGRSRMHRDSPTGQKEGHPGWLSFFRNNGHTLPCFDSPQLKYQGASPGTAHHTASQRKAEQPPFVGSGSVVPEEGVLSPPQAARYRSIQMKSSTQMILFTANPANEQRGTGKTCSPHVMEMISYLRTSGMSTTAVLETYITSSSMRTVKPPTEPSSS